jgi:hypothetical protein
MIKKVTYAVDDKGETLQRFDLGRLDLQKTNGLVEDRFGAGLVNFESICVVIVVSQVQDKGRKDEDMERVIPSEIRIRDVPVSNRVPEQ